MPCSSVCVYCVCFSLCSPRRSLFSLVLPWIQDSVPWGKIISFIYVPIFLSRLAPILKRTNRGALLVDWVKNEAWFGLMHHSQICLTLHMHTDHSRLFINAYMLLNVQCFLSLNPFSFHHYLNRQHSVSRPSPPKRQHLTSNNLA